MSGIGRDLMSSFEITDIHLVLSEQLDAQLGRWREIVSEKIAEHEAAFEREIYGPAGKPEPTTWGAREKHPKSWISSEVS